MVSSQQFVPIEDIRDDLVFLRDGGVSLIVETSAVNFGLLFETEQMAIIESFAGLLNSLSFPIQVVVYSKRLDVSSYLSVLDKAAESQTNPLLKTMTGHYRRFVESMIKEKNVLDKQFYVCLTISPLELGIRLKNNTEKSRKALTLLVPRRDHMLRQLSRLGLKSRQLATVDLVKLFYDWYNPPFVIASPLPNAAQTVPPLTQVTTTNTPTPLPVPSPEQKPTTPPPLMPPVLPAQQPPAAPPPPPQPIQFAPTVNTQIRVQPSPAPQPPSDLQSLLSSQSRSRSTTPFVVEELNDE